ADQRGRLRDALDRQRVLQAEEGRDDHGHRARSLPGGPVMAKGPSAQPLAILAGVENAEFAYLEYTVASSVVTLVRAPKGWSLGNFSSGIAALTFPKHYQVFFPFVG